MSEEKKGAYYWTIYLSGHEKDNVLFTSINVSYDRADVFSGKKRAKTIASIEEKMRQTVPANVRWEVEQIFPHKKTNPQKQVESKEHYYLYEATVKFMCDGEWKPITATMGCNYPHFHGTQRFIEVITGSAKASAIKKFGGDCSQYVISKVDIFTLSAEEGRKLNELYPNSRMF